MRSCSLGVWQTSGTAAMTNRKANLIFSNKICRSYNGASVKCGSADFKTCKMRHITYVLVWSKSDQRRLRKTLHKQTDKQTDRHYENNGHLAVNQLCKLHNMLHSYCMHVTQSAQWYIAKSKKILHYILKLTLRPGKLSSPLFMVALCNRADHYIFMLWFVLLSFFLFFPRLISAVGDWMFTILWHIVWP